jgi:hypothetical protein
VFAWPVIPARSLDVGRTWSVYAEVNRVLSVRLRNEPKITDFDDARGVFLIGFVGAVLQEPSLLAPPATTVRERVTTYRLARPGQRAFAFRVFKRYGASCALCDQSVRSILEAAHVIPVKDGGTNSTDNGLALCRNHHRAFDIDLVAFEPETVRVDLLHDWPQAVELQLAHQSLEHLTSRPDERALRWRWGTSREVAGVLRSLCRFGDSGARRGGGA